MKLANAVREAYKRKWSYINNFEVYINWVGQGTNPGTKAGFKANEDLSLNIKDFTTSQLSYEPIEFFQANSWRVTTGKPNLNTFQITFRDQDQMSLYRKFVIAYYAQQVRYFDEAKCTVTLLKGADYLDESDKKLITFEDCLISSISQLNFSNETEAQIAEFTVEFTCVTVVIHGN